MKSILTVEATSLDLLSESNKKGFTTPFKRVAYAPLSCEMATALNSFLCQPNRAVLCL